MPIYIKFQSIKDVLDTDCIFRCCNLHDFYNIYL